MWVDAFAVQCLVFGALSFKSLMRLSESFKEVAQAMANNEFDTNAPRMLAGFSGFHVMQGPVLGPAQLE